MKIHCSAIHAAPGVTLYHTGPALDHGPLPSVFYFSLSGPDSLTLDPFNQPIQFLSGKMIRAFSLTLPAHEEGLSPHDALGVWADDFSKGKDCLDEFLTQVQTALDFAIRERFIDPTRLAVAGLSRGGLTSFYLAAREPRFRFILGFAPLTKLSLAKEFHGLEHLPLVHSYDSSSIAPLISDRHIRLYIGNRDTRVSTRACFDFSMHLVDAAKTRTPQIELIISPSVGQMGHGTPPSIFQQGAAWLEECLSHG
ncbi:MAG: prolyl oligopeptidase family serine peptidase [Verrucomicrobia bacterium]|nr:prolyl oligopeptidase family serine peptidase [Verrucomicrobiota bacterium]